MNRLSYLFAGFAAAMCALLLTSSAFAQGVNVTPTSATTVAISPEGYHEFNVTVRFDGFSPLTFYVERTVNDLPDDNWQTAICMADLCYSATVSKTDPVTLMPNQDYKVKLNVITGADKEKTGRVVLKFVEDGFGTSFGEIEFITTTSDVASVPTITNLADLAFPNPALTDLTIPLTAVSSPQQVEVYNLMGLKVATFSDAEVIGNNELRFSLANFAAGLYHYKIVGLAETKVGSFSVVK